MRILINSYLIILEQRIEKMKRLKEEEEFKRKYIEAAKDPLIRSVTGRSDSELESMPIDILFEILGKNIHVFVRLMMLNQSMRQKIDAIPNIYAFLVQNVFVNDLFLMYKDNASWDWIYRFESHEIVLYNNEVMNLCRKNQSFAIEIGNYYQWIEEEFPPVITLTEDSYFLLSTWERLRMECNDDSPFADVQLQKSNLIFNLKHYDKVPDIITLEDFERLKDNDMAAFLFEAPPITKDYLISFITLMLDEYDNSVDLALFLRRQLSLVENYKLAGNKMYTDTMDRTGIYNQILGRIKNSFVGDHMYHMQSLGDILFSPFSSHDWLLAFEKLFPNNAYLNELNISVIIPVITKGIRHAGNFYATDENRQWLMSLANYLEEIMLNKKNITTFLELEPGKSGSFIDDLERLVNIVDTNTTFRDIGHKMRYILKREPSILKLRESNVKEVNGELAKKLRSKFQLLVKNKWSLFRFLRYVNKRNAIPYYKEAFDKIMRYYTWLEGVEEELMTLERIKNKAWKAIQSKNDQKKTSISGEWTEMLNYMYNIEENLTNLVHALLKDLETRPFTEEEWRLFLSRRLFLVIVERRRKDLPSIYYKNMSSCLFCDKESIMEETFSLSQFCSTHCQKKSHALI